MLVPIVVAWDKAGMTSNWAHSARRYREGFDDNGLLEERKKKETKKETKVLYGHFLYAKPAHT